MAALTRMSLLNRLVVGLVAALVGVFGIVATTSLNQETLPSLSTPGIIVTGVLPGASPDVVEKQLTEPVETALSSVSGIDTVSSESSTGQMTAIVMWPFGEDEDEMADAVRSTVDGVKGSLPAGAEVEVVSAAMDDTPVLQVAVSSSGDAAGLGERLESTLVPELEGVEGVSRVDVVGLAEKQLRITVRAQDAEDLDVPAASIPQALETAGVVTPAGQGLVDGKALSIEVGASLGTVEDVQAIPVTTADGDSVALADIADVELVDEARTSIAHAGGEEALIVSVVKDKDANVVAVSHGVRDALDRAGPELGEDVEFTTVFDQAPFIEQSIHDLTVEGGLGLLFAVLVILLFLGSFRSTLVAAISIPLSLLIAMIGLWAGGYTLNMLTLGALTIAVGRVVDDSIVVIENIRRRQGMSELTVPDIVDSVRQVAGAITASTLTTVAVFLPIAFVSGIAGELFSPFAVTVTLALLASLLVALTIVPTVSYWVLRRAPRPLPAAKQDRMDARYEAWQEKQESRALVRQRKKQVRIDRRNAKRAAKGRALLPDAALEHPLAPMAEGEASTPVDGLQRAVMPSIRTALRHPGRTLALSLVILLVTLGMTSMLRTDLLGSQGQNTLSVSQTLPQGTTLEDSVAAAQPVEEALEDDPDVATYVSSLQAGSGSGANTFTVTLRDGADAPAATSRLRGALTGLDGAGEVEVQDAASAALSGDVEIRLTGEDIGALEKAADQVTAEGGELDGVESARNDLAGEQRIIRVDVDRAAAAEQGFTQADVGQAVAAAVDGAPAGTVTLEGSERDIVIAPTNPDASPEEIAALELPVSQRQTQRAQEAEQDDIEDITDERTAQAEREAEDAADEQLQAARDAREKASEAVQDARDQRDALDDPQSMVPQDPAQALQEQKDAADEMVEQAEQGYQDAQDAVDDLIQAREDQEADREEQDALAERQKGLTDITGEPITVGEIAEVSEQPVPATISRQDGTRQITVSLTPGPDQLNVVSAGVAELTASTDLPDGVSFVVEGADAEMMESFTQLGIAMLAAIALVLLVMIGTFRSLVEPLILLVSIPFAATGAVVLLLLTDTALGLPALIGLLMLIGIVVTNAIVLMDLIGKLRAEGMELMDAVLHGTRLRLRPILMTAAATVFALVPMSLGLTGGGLFISQPLAIVVIGGLTSSTLLTLVLVPVLYVLVRGRRERKLERRAARRAERRRAQEERVASGAADEQPRAQGPDEEEPDAPAPA
ncbi:efflux RND transporter permease subunit [Brachybacterium hainanense]|uniref:Efflux RND transporter permease subunit n=1 Tax=Brachybacterium hainanense TaxID=1541174 RepID=A0ABV6RFE6_9MICO